MRGNFESNTPLLAILDNMPFMAWYKDAKGRFIAINQPFAQAIGKPREEIIGKTDFDVWPYELALSYVADDNEVMRTRTKKSVEESINDSAGGLWFETFKAPVLDEQGNVIGTIGMAKDISQRVQFQLALEDQKRFIRSMIDASPDLIFFKDVNSVYLGCNQAFSQQFIGLTEEEIIGKTDLDFVKDTALAEFFRQKDLEVFQRKETLFNEETIQLVNGERIDVETAKTPFYNNEGQLEGIIGIARDITSRKKFEKQLKEQIDYSQMLLQTIPTGIYTTDNAKNITSWNTMAEIITGYEAAEVIGKNVEQFSFNPCQEDCELFFGKMAANPANMTCKIRNKHGEIKYIFKTVDVLRNDAGDMIGQIECFNDITEQVFIEEQLKESQMRLSLAINNTNIGMWDWKIPSGELTLNEQWAALRGYTLSEFLPIDINTWKNNTHPEDIKKAMDIINQCLTGVRDFYECEIRLKHKDGYWVWVLDRGKIIEWDDAGNAVRMIGTNIDITARKHAEDELKKKERLLAAVAMSIKELIETKDYLQAVATCFQLIGNATMVDQVCLFINGRDEQGEFFSGPIVKWSPDTADWLTAKQDLQNIPFVDMEPCMTILAKGEVYYGAVTELKSEQMRIMLASRNIQFLVLLPVFVRNVFWGFVGFDEYSCEKEWTDSELSILIAFVNSFGKTIERSLIASELEAAKRSAEAANELKSQFVANMSHEIRTPMHAILGYAALMKESNLNEQNIGYLAAIQKAGDTLMNLINDVLDLSKIEAGKLEIQTSSVAVVHLFEEIRDIFSLRVQEKKLALTMEIDTAVPEVLLMDEVRIRQILFNLVGNAIKFTETGAVNVAAKVSNVDESTAKFDLIFTVSDTGIGIPVDQQQAIFEPFKQKNGQSNKQYGGTGLGLAIAKRLIDMMGGFIEVQSVPDIGSTFTVTIPNLFSGKPAQNSPASATKKQSQITAINPEAVGGNAIAVEDVQPEMLEKLEVLKQGLWQECSKTNRVSDIRKLAESIQAIGAVYQHEEIIGFANRLQAYAGSFDLKNIKLVLGQFPVILERLQQTGREGESNGNK